jgi:hypothetical protein
VQDQYCHRARQACREQCQQRHQGGEPLVQYSVTFTFAVPYGDFEGVVELGQPWRLPLRSFVVVLEEELAKLMVASVGAQYQDLVLLRFLRASYEFESDPPGTYEETCTSYMCGPKLYDGAQAEAWLRQHEARVDAAVALRVRECRANGKYCEPLGRAEAPPSNWEVRVALEGLLLLPESFIKKVGDHLEWWTRALVRKHRATMNQVFPNVAWTHHARHQWGIEELYGDRRLHQADMRARLEKFRSFDLLHASVLQAWKWRYSNEERAATHRGLIYLDRARAQKASHFCTHAFQTLRDMGRLLLEGRV